MCVCVCSHAQHGVHRVGGHDVRDHHRPAALAPGGDDLLLQEDRRGRRGSAQSQRVSNTPHTQTQLERLAVNSN